jgi:Flp pilus assembly protein TadG
MKRKKFSAQRSTAQAMVEFAIALPILLLIVYGIFETGRFLFIYSSVVTASRQAVRYGAATGDGNEGEKRYKDCDGIRATANAAGYVGGFDSITLQHDTGPDSSVTTYCDGSPLPTQDTSSWNPSSDNTDRLVVTVTEQFSPILREFLPFIQRTITATSARTIFVSINITVTAVPGSFSDSGSGAITLNILSPGTYSAAGQSVAFTYRVTNSGTVGDIDISRLTISTDKGSATCTNPPSALAQGASFDCTGTYTTTQADVNNGSFTNTATATTGSLSDNDIEILTAAQFPALALDKVSDIDASAVVGTVITYTYYLTNSGNVTLGPPYDINDNKIGDYNITCPASGDIDPGQTTQCTGTYTIKNSDVSAGTIVNVATGTAVTVTASPQTVTSNSDSVTIYTPALYLTVSASQSSVDTASQVINYTYKLKNISASNIRSPYTVTDNRVTNETCPSSPATMTPGTTVICTGSYTVTQADLDSGAALVNTITATARKATGSQIYTSNTVTLSVTVTQNPVLNLAISTNPSTATTVGENVTYAYTLTNGGNVTLSPTFNVTDDKVSGITCTDSNTAIAPGGTKTCAGTRAITQEDIDNGLVTNTATASASVGDPTASFSQASASTSSSQSSASITSSQSSATVTTYVGARLTLSITANPNPAHGSGQLITFTYTLRNTGSVPLSSPYSVTSSLTGNADCSSAFTTINVDSSISCVGFYTTTSADVTNGSVTDSATATAMDGAATVTSNNAILGVPVSP